jgi:hypothetical protein
MVVANAPDCSFSPANTRWPDIHLFSYGTLRELFQLFLILGVMTGG